MTSTRLSACFRPLGFAVALTVGLATVAPAAIAADSSPAATPEATATVQAAPLWALDAQRTGEIRVHTVTAVAPDAGTVQPTGTSNLRPVAGAVLAATPITSYLGEALDLTTEAGWRAATALCDAVNAAGSWDVFYAGHAADVTLGAPVEKTSDADGLADFSGLDLGLFTISETVAPTSWAPIATFVSPSLATDDAGTGWSYTVDAFPKPDEISIAKDVSRHRIAAEHEVVTWTIDADIPSALQDAYTVEDVLSDGIHVAYKDVSGLHSADSADADATVEDVLEHAVDVTVVAADGSALPGLLDADDFELDLTHVTEGVDRDGDDVPLDADALTVTATAATLAAMPQIVTDHPGARVEVTLSSEITADARHCTEAIQAGLSASGTYECASTEVANEALVLVGHSAVLSHNWTAAAPPVTVSWPEPPAEVPPTSGSTPPAGDSTPPTDGTVPPSTTTATPTHPTGFAMTGGNIALALGGGAALTVGALIFIYSRRRDEQQPA
ncbi:SpaH/EbpB family LPXTG-anchored major pilin [Demequina pelophila]|uniref:SpaH/EbpB family LPXTG-anchored major pilin n=1 Tax=Demequina pelophila TaxID=1638984 RepID=UPI000785B1CA|nr:SpaH/EbpB family LPXTG-anchored major pilin [Demequina pelophila]